MTTQVLANKNGELHPRKMTQVLVNRDGEPGILAHCRYGTGTGGIAWEDGALACPQIVKVAHGHGLAVATSSIDFVVAATDVAHHQSEALGPHWIVPQICFHLCRFQP